MYRRNLEGALISVTDDECLHLWNLRQRKPMVVQSLAFKRESVAVCMLPIFTKWLYIGTEKGNVFVVNLETLDLSGYQIMWNQTIPKSQKVHPGPVTSIEQHPIDPSKILIGYENGRLVVWDLKCKVVVNSYSSDKPLSCSYWISDVKQFVTGHIEGSIAFWNFRGDERPSKMFRPHDYHRESSSPLNCNLINKIQWLSTKLDPFLIFTGGVPGADSSHFITIFHGRKREVLDLKKPIIDFFTVCASPFAKDLQEPTMLVALLCNDMIAIDLTTASFAQMAVPYGVSIGVSPVTALMIYPDCPHHLMEDLDRSPLVKSWPVDGGEWGRQLEEVYDLAITGHEDGSIQLWDVSGVTLSRLDILTTSQYFVPIKEGGDETALSISHISLCTSGRTMAIGFANSQLLIMNWGTQDVTGAIPSVSVFLSPPEFTTFDFDSMEEESTSPTLESPKSPVSSSTLPVPGGEPTEEQKRAAHLLSKFGIEVPQNTCSAVDNTHTEPVLSVITEPVKQEIGLQVVLVCQCLVNGTDAPGSITCIELSSAWGLVAYGSTHGVVIVDYIQRTVLWSQSNADLLGICYPHIKLPLSCKISNSKSKKLKISKIGSFTNTEEDNLVSPKARKGTQRGKMLSIIRRDKVAEGSNSTLNSHRKARKQGSGGSMDSPNSPSSPSEGDTNAESYVENFVVQSLCFVDSYTDKDISGNQYVNSFIKSFTSHKPKLDEYGEEIDDSPRRNPTLWIGSYSGALLSQTINIPPGDHRKKIPCQITNGGSPVFLKSPIISISALDNEGNPVASPSSTWHDDSKKSKKSKSKKKGMPDDLTAESDLQSNDYLVIAAEKSILVLKLPSQNSYARQKIFDNTYFLKAQVLAIPGPTVCLACISIMGHISIYNLPQLKPLADIPWFGPGDTMSLRTFKTGLTGHSIFMCSPTEFQMLTLVNKNQVPHNPSSLTEITHGLNDLMLPETLGMVFAMREAPEPPRRGLLNVLLRRNSMDRAELFGAAAGPISPGVVEKVLKRFDTPGAVNDINKVKDALNERAEKMSEIEKKTDQLKMEAESFASTSHLLHMKVKEQNKWF